MSNVSLIDGHLDGAEQCVMCGRDIPEGSQVCVICGRGKPKKQTNYDRIRNMSVEELAKFLLDVRWDYEYSEYVTGSGERFADYHFEKALAEEIKWLESEVDTE